MRNIKTEVIAVLLVVFAILLSGCATDATIASQNLSIDAEQFKIERKIIFYNGITDKIMFVVEGRCSIEVDSPDRQLEVTCKVGPNEYKKEFLGLADNVTYIVQQLETVDTNVYRYKFIIKPETIIPDFDLETSLDKE